MLCGGSGAVEASRTLPVRIAFLGPKYWATWVGLGVLRGIELLPFAGQRRVAAGIGAIIRRLPLRYVRIADRLLWASA